MEAPTTSQPSGGVILACLNCADQRLFDLSPGQLADFFNNREVQLFCPNCQAYTTWSGLERARRPDKPRRTRHRVRVALPIRVRSDAPELRFTEVTRTLSASRDGACFYSRQPLRQGMVLYVQIPYEEVQTLPDTPARVVHVAETSDQSQVAVKFLP